MRNHLKRCLIVVFFLIAVGLRSAVGAAEPLPKRLLTDEIQKILSNPPKDGSFNFVVMGDSRDGDSVFAYLLQLANEQNPAFIINVGDFVHSGQRREYLHYFDQISGGKAPYLSVIGNHEAHVDEGYGNYVEMFGEPDFYFDYGGVRFIALDNSGKIRYGLTDGQMKWLDAALQTDLEKIVFMHAPPRNRLWPHSMNLDKNNDAFMELVESRGVKKVYVGHMHAYDRLRRGGTEYVITGGAGAEPDPVTPYYNKLAGGLYHFVRVEVRDGKTMDVLVEPVTSNLLDFVGPDGDGLELTYGAYRHFNSPVFESLSPAGEARSGAPVPIAVSAQSHPNALEVGLRSLDVECVDASGARTGPIALRPIPSDERRWTGALPAMSAGTAECYASAVDGLYSRFQHLPPLSKIAKGRDLNPKDIPYAKIAEDPDDSILKVIDELDLLETGFAFDDDYFYMKMKTQGGFKGGSKTPPRRLNVYGFIIMNEDYEIQGEPDKLLSEVPVLIYAPYASAMGMPKCGVLNLKEIRQGKMDVSAKGLKCLEDGDALYMRAERSVYPQKFTGAKVMTAALQLIMDPKFDANLGDAMDIVHVKFGGVPLEVK